MKKTILSALISIIMLSGVISVYILQSAGAGYLQTDNGIQFTATDVYTTLDMLENSPNTFEAWIKVPSSLPASSRGGVILGNYMNKNTSCVSFEIYSNYNPRLYLSNSGATTSFVFDQVTIPLDTWTHLAIVRDETAKSVYCYIDGNLMQTLDSGDTGTYQVGIFLGVGGDLRTGNAQYFKGSICEAAVFYDARTANQISSDYMAVDDSSADLFGHWIMNDPDSAGVDLSGHENHIEGLYKTAQTETTAGTLTDALTTKAVTTNAVTTTVATTADSKGTVPPTEVATPNTTGGAEKTNSGKGCNSSVSIGLLPVACALLIGAAGIRRKNKKQGIK